MTPSKYQVIVVPSECCLIVCQVFAVNSWARNPGLSAVWIVAGDANDAELTRSPRKNESAVPNTCGTEPK